MGGADWRPRGWALFWRCVPASCNPCGQFEVVSKNGVPENLNPARFVSRAGLIWASTPGKLVWAIVGISLAALLAACNGDAPATPIPGDPASSTPPGQSAESVAPPGLELTTTVPPPPESDTGAGPSGPGIAGLDVAGYLAACEASLSAAIGQYEDSISGASESGSPTWGQFARLHDLLGAELELLDPPPELGRFHAATVQMVRAMQSLAQTRPADGLLAEELTRLLVDSIFLESVELDPQWSSADTGNAEALESHLEQTFGDFFGAELIAASEEIASARAALSAPLNQRIGESACLFADLGATPAMLPGPIGASIQLLEDISGSTTEEPPSP